MRRSATVPGSIRDPTLGAAVNEIDGLRDGAASAQAVAESDYEPVLLSSVYFALDPDACQIKIGYTSRPVERRLAELRERRPNLQLLGTIRGNRRLEHAMHGRFDQHRREAREWYSSEIAADVLALLAA